MPLTPEAKKLLAETIRGTAQDPYKGVRARLLRAIHDEAERRYRLAVPIAQAGLDEAHRKRRERIEAYIAERARALAPKTKTELEAAEERLLAQCEKEAAATLVNRLVLLRHLEALGLSKPQVVTGGWNSKGYREYREFAPTLCTNGTTDATEGYATLLQLVFDELSIDLPGLFGDVGLTRLFPVPAAALRDLVECLDHKDLASAWTDDTTLGWVYQYWNDPDREALDAKINDGGKIEPHEIASKTQMFTERYMVEWLLQNSLGLTWLAMCRKHGWKPAAEPVLARLEERRAAFRKQREAGEVPLDALMPIEGELEEHWKYYVPQPIPEDAVEKAPESVAAIKLLDPACGSGHFLVIAFDLLAALYREEAAHHGTSITDEHIAESILENNLHGIDIDPRAIQIAAAGLYLKAKTLSKAARPKKLNLVAPVLQLGNLPEGDENFGWFRLIAQQSGIPEGLTTRLVRSLAGVDYLGSLFKVDQALAAIVADAEVSTDWVQQALPADFGLPVAASKPTTSLQVVAARSSSRKVALSERLEAFLARHSTSEDLGLRLDGEQLAAGVRFVRMAREGTYDVVVGNPPYQGLTKTSSFGYVTTTYPRGKSDLYAAFLERGLELVRDGGISGLLTMRGWMYLGQFTDLRKEMLRSSALCSLGDVDRGAFEDVPDEVLATVMSVFRKSEATSAAVALQPTPPEDRARDGGRTARKRAALLAQVGRYEFDPRSFDVIEGEPLVYWWSEGFLKEYAAAPKLGQSHTVRYGLSTQNNSRWLRAPWEVHRETIMLKTFADAGGWDGRPWVTYIKGSEGRAWCDEVSDVVLWRHKGLELATYPGNRFGRGTTWYFTRGVAFANIGSSFSARAHSRPSIFGHVAGSVFSSDTAAMVCLLNSRKARGVMESLNPGIHFLTTDVERLPLLPIAGSARIFSRVESAFLERETRRECSIDFLRPGPSAWTYAQGWAQLAVDRSEGSPLPPYEPTYEEPEPTAFVSFALGIALGRFGANGEGILDTAPADALPAGLLFLAAEGADSLSHPACKPLLQAWGEHGGAVGKGDELSAYLRKSFFEFHKKLYENRPIYFPLSSAKKSFVAYASIHRWADDTLNVLLADHLLPHKRRLEGEVEDLRTARASGSNKTKAERRFADLQKLLEELTDFISKVTDIAEKGAPPPDDKTEKRHADAKFTMDLDDGVMVNSAALWTLLEPQWKDPKKWWKELCNAQGKKDYDWAHLAARYFPERVKKKCHEDPSLAVAHKCFWELHPAKAYAWELRLKSEIDEEFTIDEPGAAEARKRFLKAHAREANEIMLKELKRREKKGAEAEDDPGDGDASVPLDERGGGLFASRADTGEHSGARA